MPQIPCQVHPIKVLVSTCNNMGSFYSTSIVSIQIFFCKIYAHKFAIAGPLNGFNWTAVFTFLFCCWFIAYVCLGIVILHVDRRWICIRSCKMLIKSSRLRYQFKFKPPSEINNSNRPEWLNEWETPILFRNKMTIIYCAILYPCLDIWMFIIDE